MDHVETVILVSLIGFILLAVIVLLPVYRFLRREEEVGKQWSIKPPPSPHEHSPGRTNGSATP